MESVAVFHSTAGIPSPQRIVLIWLHKVEHHEDTSVVLYEEEGFEGKSAAFLEGDFKGPKLKQVASIRVPAGFWLCVK